MNQTMTLSVEPSEKGRVSPAALIRRSGLLSVAAGTSMILAPLVHPESPQSAAWVPVHLLYFATIIAVLLVLVGILAHQFQRAGRLGVVGFLTAFVGTAMGLLEGREHLFSHDFGQGTPVGLWQLILAALVFSVGYVLLGIAITRAGVFPRGAGILLAVSGPVVAFSPPIGILAVLIVAHTLFGLGLAWVGYALWTGPEREPAGALDRDLRSRLERHRKGGKTMLASGTIGGEGNAGGSELPSRWERPALASGILFVVVQIATIAFTAVFFATTHPPIDASPTEAARGFARAETMVAVGTYLYVLQVPFLLLFLGGLFGVLRRVEGGSGALAISVLGAGVAMVVIASMGALVSAITPTIGQLGGDGATVKAIDGMTPLALALSAFPRAVLLGATSVVLQEGRVVPRWICWTGLALAVISLASTGTLLTPALFPFLALGTLLFVLWIAALSVALLRNPQPASRL